MKPIRGYIVSHRAYYKMVINRPTINLGLYYQNPKDTPDKEDFYGEMSLEYDTGVRGWILRCYDDGWRVLDSFSDVLKKLAKCIEDNCDIDDNTIINILDSCGFKDLTEYTKEGLI